MSEEKVFLTNDKNMTRDSKIEAVMHEADEKAMSGCDIVLKPEEMLALAEMANKIGTDFRDIVRREMTTDRAQYIRDLRCDENHTWRGVAAACDWGCDWGSNQLAGMALCECAADLFGENFMEAPWN